MRTSYSAIETYLQCPQKYKFQEIDKIKTSKSREAIFGTLVHETLKYMFQRDPLFPTLDEVVGYFRTHWPKPAENKKPLWSPDEEKIYFEEGVRMLKKFYEKNAPWNYTVLDLESHFEVSLKDEKTGEIHILAGKIDRIDKLLDDTYEIIDYKTSKRMPSQSDLDKNLQLALYSLGLQKRWPHIKPEDIKLSLYFLKHGEKLSTHITADATEATKSHALKVIADIQDHQRNNKSFEPTPGPLCNWCAFKPICPAWKHLYRSNAQSANRQSSEEMQSALKEYFAIRKVEEKNKKRMAELQSLIKQFMEKERVTRIFGEDGYISKKIQQRYQYDLIKVKELLSPLGKWEEILKADEVKLRQILKEVPEEIRTAVINARSIVKEFSVLTASTKKTELVETQTVDELPGIISKTM